MGRKTKTGLDYFPFDTGLPDDDKLKFVRARFGLKGYAVYTLLLCKIYKDKGYYCNWGEDEALLFANDVGDGVNISLVNDLVQELFKRELLSKGIFERFKILTSKGIQERYQFICKQLKRTVEIDERFDVRALTQLKKELSPEKRPFPPEEIAETPEEIPQRKGKEIKGNERELRARTIEDEAWLEETAMHCRREKSEIIAFAEEYFTDKRLSGGFEKWDSESLIRFLLKDLKAGIKNGHNNKNEQGRKIGRIDAGKLQEFIDGK